VATRWAMALTLMNSTRFVSALNRNTLVEVQPRAWERPNAAPALRAVGPESPQFWMRPDEASQSGFGGRIIDEMLVRGAAQARSHHQRSERCH
jgi:hypothetical protein